MLCGRSVFAAPAQEHRVVVVGFGVIRPQLEGTSVALRFLLAVLPVCTEKRHRSEEPLLRRELLLGLGEEGLLIEANEAVQCAPGEWVAFQDPLTSQPEP